MGARFPANCVAPAFVPTVLLPVPGNRFGKLMIAMPVFVLVLLTEVMPVAAIVVIGTASAAFVNS